MRNRCKCGAGFTNSLRLFAHFAWADTLGTARARLEHGAPPLDQEVLF